MGTLAERSKLPKAPSATRRSNAGQLEVLEPKALPTKSANIATEGEQGDLHVAFVPSDERPRVRKTHDLVQQKTKTNLFANQGLNQASAVLQNPQKYLQNLAYKDKYIFLMAFLRGLDHPHFVSESADSKSPLMLWWVTLGAREQRVVKTVCALVRSVQEVYLLCRDLGSGVNQDGVRIATMVAEELTKKSSGFEISISAIMRIPASHQISGDNDRKNEYGLLKDDRNIEAVELLRRYLTAKGIAENRQAPLVKRIERDVRDALHGSGALVLPTVAPKLYADRPAGQSIIDFLQDKDGWGPYVAAGVLTKPALRRLDWPAYKALDNWQRTKPVPPEVHLPTGKQVNDAALAAADTPDRVREGVRLMSAKRYRLRRAPT